MNLLDLARSALASQADDGHPQPHPPSKAVAANDDTARRWLVCFPNLDPMEVLFTPDATRAEVAAIYPRARIEPQADPPQRTATPAEVAELPELVALIFADDTEDHRAEALAAALADPEAALTSFRLLAADAMEAKRHEVQFRSANG